MKAIWATLLAGLLLCGCASKPAATPAPAPVAAVPDEELAPTPGVVLILTAQNIDPAQDTAGYNATVAKVTQDFSRDMAARLGAFGRMPVNVIDQHYGTRDTEKLTVYALRERAPMALLLSLEAQTVDGDQRISLRVQCLQLRLNQQGGKPHGITVKDVLQRTFMLHSSVSGDRQGTMDDIAGEVIATLHVKGWV